MLHRIKKNDFVLIDPSSFVGAQQLCNAKKQTRNSIQAGKYIGRISPRDYHTSWPIETITDCKLSLMPQTDNKLVIFYKEDIEL